MDAGIKHKNHNYVSAITTFIVNIMIDIGILKLLIDVKDLVNLEYSIA